MVYHTNKSWHDCRALNQNWSYQSKFAGHAILDSLVQTKSENMRSESNWQYKHIQL